MAALAASGATVPDVRDVGLALAAGEYDEHLSYLADLLQVRRERRSKTSLRSFKTGDQVSFETRSGKRLAGTVIKPMTKNVKVRVPIEGSVFGQEWTVSPTLLTKES